MKKLALIGKNISHSKSQKVYESILGEAVDYTLVDIPAVEDVPALEELFEAFDGVSITAPYKQALSDRVLIRDPSLRELGSINCMRKQEGAYEGTSTDFFALQDLFEDLKKSAPFSAAILGDGSMARMTRFILGRMGVECKLLSRRLGNLAPDTDFTEIFPPGKKAVIINSCARGFVFRGKVPGNALFWDYNYSMDGHEEHLGRICTYQDGHSLLELQAKYALDFWGVGGTWRDK